MSGIWGDEDQQQQGMGAGMGGGYVPAVMDDATRRRLMMQVGLPMMGAQIGANLLAAAQGGQSPERRAWYMGQLGQAPMAGMQAVGQAQQQWSQDQLRQAQVANTQAQAQARQAQARGQENWQRLWAGGGGTQPPAAAGGGSAIGGAASGDLFLPVGENGEANPYLALAPHLRAGEGGNSAQGAVNPWGFAGRWQFGAPRLAELGIYTPGEGENIQTWNRTRLAEDPTKWTGQFRIPGFENVRTMRDFLANPQAQDFVFNQHMRRIDQTLDQTPGAERLDRNGLRAAAHLAGEGGVANWIATGANPADANGTTLASYYQRYSRASQPQQGQGGATIPASAPAGGGGGAPARAGGIDTSRFTPEERAIIARMPAQQGAQEALRILSTRDQWVDIPAPPGGRPGVTYQRNVRTGQLRSEGSPQVSIDQRGESAVARGLAETWVAQHKAALEAAEGDRTQFLPVLQQFRQLSGTMEGGGPATEATLPLRNLMAQIGWLSPEGAATANNQTVMRALTSRMTPLMRQAGSGDMSDRDLAMFLQSVPSIGQSQIGREVIGSLLERAIEWRTQRAELMGEYLRERGTLTGFNAHARERLPSVTIPSVRTVADLDAQPVGTPVLITNQTLRAALGPRVVGPGYYIVRRNEE